MDPFEKIPEDYEKLCELVKSLELPPEEIFDRVKEDLDLHKRRITLGAGRSGIIADTFKDFLMNLGYEEVYGPDNVPRIFTPDDVVFSFTGSGTTKLTVRVSEIARKAGATIIGFTSDLNTNFAKNIANYVVHIKGKSKKDSIQDYYSRQLTGTMYTPLTPLGTLFELRLLFTLLSFVGSLAGKRDMYSYYEELYKLARGYKPKPEDFRMFYKVMPKPKRKTNPWEGKIVGIGDGLSGNVCKFFLSRLSNCAKDDEERDCRFYKDCGTIKMNKNDLGLVISGCGRYLSYELAKTVKEEIGAKIVSLTSYPDSPLGEISDVVIYVPGRIIEKVKGLRSSYMPTDPKKSIFELRATLALESFIYAISQVEGITEEHMRNKHSRIK